ncbi:hypothetical protein L9F63_012103, partial [Diploptera punctata]
WCMSGALPLTELHCSVLLLRHRRLGCSYLKDSLPSIDPFKIFHRWSSETFRLTKEDMELIFSFCKNPDRYVSSILKLKQLAIVATRMCDDA